MNNHPISSAFSFRDLIYKLSVLQITLVFFTIFTSLSLVFFALYSFTIEHENISSFILLKYTIFQSFGFDIDSLKINSKQFEYLNFIQLYISLVISLIFTSSIVLKYFTKPNLFYFKSKVNIDKDTLIISLYNKTDFQATNAHFDVYARLPYVDKEGFNSLNNVQLHPKRSIFPFMDKHLVTRLKIDLNAQENNTDFTVEGMNKSILELLDVNRNLTGDKIQYLRISIFVNVISDKIDNSVYEIKNYQININDIKSIENNITFQAPNSIDIDMVDFSKSKGWENFED